MINGKIGEINYNDENARGSQHNPVISSLKFDPVGQLKVGRLITKTNIGAVPLTSVYGETAGIGDGTNKAFSGVLNNYPVEPGTLMISDFVETFFDDGHGRLYSDAGGVGTTRYETGSFEITFSSSVANSTHIAADYITAVDGVLNENLDTDNSDICTCIVHGSVKLRALKINDNDEAPDNRTLEALSKNGMFAE